MVRVTGARLKDVAERAGVSLTTASIILRRQPGARVTTSTRERVDRAALDLGYRPPARHPASRLTGVVLDSGRRDVEAEFLLYLTEELHRIGSLPVVLPVTGAQDQACSAAAAATSSLLEGLVVVRAPGSALAAPEGVGGTRRVLVELEPHLRRRTGNDHPTVVPDDVAAARRVAAEARRQGHERAVVVAEISTVAVAECWVQGLGALVAGSAEPIVVHDRDGYQVSTEQPDLGSPGATVMVCMDSSSAAVGAALAESRGLVVGRDITIVARTAGPVDLGCAPVSWVPIPLRDIARTAVRLLHDGAAISRGDGASVVSVPYDLKPGPSIPPRPGASRASVDFSDARWPVA